MTKLKLPGFRIPLFLVLSVVLCLSFFLFPRPANAQSASGEQVWGGRNIVDFDADVCTCGGNSHWRLDYKTDSVILLYYQAGQSTLFSNYNIYSTYQLGSYSYGSQVCSIDLGEECVDITNDGTFGSMPGNGTSVTKKNTDKNIFAKNKLNILFGEKDTWEFPKSTSFTFIYDYFPGAKNF